MYRDLAGAVVLVVHAHPDDEVFATGAATIAAESAGTTVPCGCSPAAKAARAG